MKDIILMSTADWSNPFWTNKQHTAKTLAKLGYRVFYIDSLGSRKLRLKQSGDLSRIWQRLKRLFAKPEQVEENIYVWSPCVLPPSESRMLTGINRLVFSSLLRFWMKDFNFSRDAWLWTYNPLTFLYLKPGQFSKIIYHCVDNIAEQPDALVQLIDQQEKNLFKAADKVFVTARALEVKARQYSDEVYYHSNVVDYQHFNRAFSDIDIPADLLAIPAPRALFVGAISAYKVNMPLLLEVARQLPQVSFVMIGSVGEGDPDTNIEAFGHLNNVYFLGPRQYELLPNYLKGANACLIPAKVNEYTKSMFPMKFFEYLAAGKPIVATDIPAISEFADVYYQAGEADAFASQLKQAIADHPADKLQAGMSLASEHTYLSRTQKMLGYILS